MSMTLRAFNEMFPTENVVRALREGTLAERYGMPPARQERSSHGAGPERRRFGVIAETADTENSDLPLVAWAKGL